jgi:multidrug efflux pump subunit AcrB
MESRGLIKLFSEHPVAGNLLMILMILFGSYGLTQLSRQVLPDFELDAINISVQWPGASPVDVEANILEAIEREIRFLENVEQVNSGATEGSAGITITYKEDTNMSAALTAVQAAVARIRTFPSDMERPVISQIIQGDDVCRIEVSGPFPEESLKRFAKRIRSDLLDRGMARITMVGLREAEIRVEISDDVLRQLDLTLNDISTRIAQSSLDLPSGSIESGGVLRQIRSETMARSAREVSEIEVLSQKTGEKLRLKDIARIYETFEDDAITHVLDDYTSVGLIVGRAKGVDSISRRAACRATADAARRHVRRICRSGHPACAYAREQWFHGLIARDARALCISEWSSCILGRYGNPDIYPRRPGRHGGAWT